MVAGRDELARLCHDPWWFISRLQIINNRKEVDTLHSLRQEQIQFIEAFLQHQQICVLKSRQLGISTIALACIFWKFFIQPNPRGLLSITHESGATSSMNNMLRRFALGLPRAIRPQLTVDNSKLIVTGSNGAGFGQLMAGGRGGGRSFTYSDLHCTEMSYWPRGSAATGSTEGGVDEATWASARSTMHQGAGTHTIVESTAEGGHGIFSKIVHQARTSDNWCFLFFPWFEFAEYAMDVPPRWERTDEEDRLAALHGLNDRQLAWRRFKIEDEGYGFRRFRKEYPSTPEEPWLVVDGTWFDSELLNEMLASIHNVHFEDMGELRIFEKPIPGQRYYIGADSSGGVGKDWSVVTVLDEKLTQVAVGRSKRWKPHAFGDRIAKLAGYYNRAQVLVESNGYGKAVIARLTNLGTLLWKDDKGKDWWTQGGKAGQTKKWLYDFIADMVHQGWMDIRDDITINEMLHIREMDNGNIEAPEGMHDDHADALALALWCARRAATRRDTTDVAKRRHRARMARSKHPFLYPGQR